MVFFLIWFFKRSMSSIQVVNEDCKYTMPGGIEFTSPQTCQVNLSPGKYLFEVWGAQGGRGLINSEPSNSGGCGAYTKGELQITGNYKDFYVVVGGKGGDGVKDSGASGGYNGGGRGGRDEGIWPGNGDDSGGGGGASDIRVKENVIINRIMVAGGGSGGVRGIDGAPGGDIYGYDINDKSLPIQTDLVSQSNGNVNGCGTKGEDTPFTPGSGGGGGYRGGYGGEWGGLNYYLAVGTSGSSYVNGYSGCSDFYLNDIEKFEKIEIVAGLSSNSQKKVGDGKISIKTIYECLDGCHTCNGGGLGKCSKCFDNYYIFESNCLISCPTNTYANGKSCAKCYDSKCLRCSGGGVNDCIECENNYFLNPDRSCKITCQDGYYKEGRICKICHNDCKTCSGSSDQECLSCRANLIYFEHKCVNNCPIGSYPINNTENSSIICEPCNANCSTCDGPNYTNCITCQESYKLYENQCYEECPKGSYLFENNITCISCDPFCSECNGPFGTKDCSACNEDYYYFENGCYENGCPERTFNSTEGTKSCSKCDSRCKSCNGPTEKNCLSCEDNQILYKNECYENCPIGAYESGEMECSECDSTCLRCNGPKETNCLNCEEGRYLYENQCFENCSEIIIFDNSTEESHLNERYFFISNKEYQICEKCNVLSCINYDLSNNSCTCIECREGYQMIKEQCEPNVDQQTQTFTRVIKALYQKTNFIVKTGIFLIFVNA